MPTLAETLKEAADTAQAAITDADTTETEPRTEIMDALTAAASAGEYSRLFPSPEDEPPLVLTRQESNWLINQSGCRLTNGGEGSVLVTFAVPGPVAP